jgi:hypothetical protein
MGIPNPFGWIDDGLDAAGEAWNLTLESFNNLVRSQGKVLSDTPGGRIAKETIDPLVETATTATKVGTRTVSTAYDFPLQVLNNTMAFGYNNNPNLRRVLPFGDSDGFEQAKGSTLEQLVGIIRNTTAGEVIADALPGGDKLDVGSGFFVGGETQKQINERKRELYPTIYGSTYTVGRSFAGFLADNGVIEPGSTSYNVISGAIDFGWTVGADPTNLLGAGTVARIGKLNMPLTAAARAGKRANVTTTLSKKSARVIDEAAKEGKIVMDAAGLIDNGRRTVSPNNWEAFKVTNKGKAWIDTFVGDNANDAAVIWRSSVGQIPPGTANKLAKAKTADEVVQILDDSVYGPDPLSHIRIMPGIDPRPIVTRTGAVIKGNVSRYRPFADTLPESTDFPLNNPLQAVKNADSVMGVLKVENETRNRLLNELFEVMDGTDDRVVFDWLNNFEQEVVASQLRQWNYSDDEIKKIASWRKRYEESVSGYVTDSTGSSVPLEWLIGGPNGGFGPLLISQQLKVNPVLIDPTDLQMMSDRLGPIRSRLETSRRMVTDKSIDPDTGEIVVDATSPRRWVDTPLAVTEAAGDLVDFLQARVWKPNVLIRPRYLIRTLPDEMLRVSASGIFDHDYQYIAQIFTNKNTKDIYGRMITTSRKAAKLEAQAMENGRLLKKYETLQNAGLTEYRGKNLTDLVVETQAEIDNINDSLLVFDERMANLLPGIDEALLRGAPGKAMDLMLHPAAVSGMLKRGNLVSVEKAVNPDLWSKAMSQRLAERASNGYYRSLAKAIKDKEPTDQITRRFLSGDLKQFLDRYIDDLGNKDPNYVWDYNGVRNFVQKNLDDLNIYTFGGDVKLLDAIIENKFLNESLSNAKGFQLQARATVAKQNVATYEPNKWLKKYIKDNYSEDPTAPARVNYFPSAFDTDSSLKNAKERVTQRYDALLSLVWDGFYGTSSDKLARNPLWSQAKWQRVVELVPVMNKSQAEQLVKYAEKSGISKSIVDDIAELAETASGEMEIKDVEQLAELFAIRFTKDQLFDASRRTAYGARHRKIFPFYDAFVELTGSALKLATNPKIIHRADKVIGEMRANEFFGSDNDGDGKKNGFLYVDPVSGEEMYAVAPPPGFLSKWRKLGLDFRFGNALSGLSMITTPYPGLSPFVALPVTAALPDSADFDKLKDMIAPYGLPDLSDPSIAQFVIPLASEQALRITGSMGLELFSDVDKRQKQMQAVIRAMQVLATTKDYDPVTPGQQGPVGYESIEQWQQDAKELGTQIYGLTGWAGLFLPAAPIAQWSAKSRNGSVLISVLSQRWNTIDKEGDNLGLDFQDKLEQFVEEFGSENLVAFLQPITDRSIVGSTSTKEYYDWYRQNKNVADKYTEVAGYFAPKSAELDPDVWNIQKIAGDVEYKDPEQFAINVESAVANFIFNRNMRSFEESIPPAQRDTRIAEQVIKAERKRQSQGLKQAYPNWDRAVAATSSVQARNVQFIEIRNFIQEPSQQDNPVVKAAQDYLDFRDQNLEYIKSRSPKIDDENWKTMKANRAAISLRGVLWQHGEKLAQQYPEFLNLWQNVLSREFISVETEE